MPHDRMGKIVVFTTVVELGTAIALLVDPGLLVALLLGVAADDTVRIVGRCLGIALFALAAAWWPDQAAAVSAHPYFRGKLVYNGGIALFLAYLGTAGHMAGLLLWPAVAVHAVASLLMVTTWRALHRKQAIAS